MSRPIAILTADWHIWDKAPLARSGEADWPAPLGRALARMAALQIKHDIPILMAGDVFDYYNPPPRTICWLLDNMPSGVWSVPGQHDMQNHRGDVLDRTGYGVLCRCSAVHDLPPWLETDVSNNIRAIGMPWGFEPAEGTRLDSGDKIRICVAHRYIWSDESNRHRLAKESSSVSAFKTVPGVKVQVCGDNHVPFSAWKDGVLFVNCGTLVARKADESREDAGFWLLHDDLTLKRVHTWSSRDVFLDAPGKPDGARAMDMAFMDRLCEGGGMEIDFRSEVLRALDARNAGAGARNLNGRIFAECEGERA